MVDNLPKIVWYSMHHSIYTEAWLLQSKRLAGKELSNPFIADDLLKIIWLSMYHGLTNLNIGYQDWSAMKTSKGPLRLKVCLKSEMGHVYKLGRDVEKLVDVVYKLRSSFGEVFGIGVVRLACSIPIGWAYAFHQDKASLVKVPVANVTLFSSAHLLRENTDSVRSNQRIRLTASYVPLKSYGMIHEDGDNDAIGGNDDERAIRSYEHYKGVGAEVEHSKPGFELQGAKMVETGKGPLRLKVCLKSEMGHVYKLGRDVEKLVDVVYKLGSSFGEVFGIG
ncbi:hypothetical protein Tco_0516641, partial [Tanacetum coccineum]